MATTINRIEWVLTTDDKASRPLAAATAKQKAALEAQKKAFKDNAKAAEQSSSSITKSSRRSATEVEKSSKTIRKSNDDHARSLDRLNASLGNTTHETQIFKTAVSALKFPALISGAGIAAQAVGTLGAASVSAVSALAPLSGAIAAYPALGSAAAQGLGVVKLAMLGVTDAVGGLNDKLDPEKLAKLSEEGQKFAKALDSMKKPVLDLQKSAQAGLFPGFTEALKTARPLIAQFRDEFKQTGVVIGQLAVDGAKLATSGPFSRDLQAQAQINAQWIGQLGHAGLNLADALRNVVRAAEPLVTWMVRVGVRASELTRAWAENARASGTLGRFFGQTREVMSLVGGSLLHVANGLIQVGKAAQPLGFHILQGLNAEAKKFSDWANTASGQNRLQAYFTNATPAVDEFGRLLRDTGRAFLTLTQGDQTLPLLKALRTELLPVLTQVVTSTTKAFGPALITALTSFVRLIGDLAGSNGPLTLFVTGLGKVAQFLHVLINSVPGLKPLLVTMAGVAAVTKVFMVAGKFSGLTTLIGLFGKLRTAAAGAAVAEGAAGAAGAGAAGGLGGKLGGKVAGAAAAASAALPTAAITAVVVAIGKEVRDGISRSLPKGSAAKGFFDEATGSLKDRILGTVRNLKYLSGNLRVTGTAVAAPGLKRGLDRMTFQSSAAGHALAVLTGSARGAGNTLRIFGDILGIPKKPLRDLANAAENPTGAFADLVNLMGRFADATSEATQRLSDITGLPPLSPTLPKRRLGGKFAGGGMIPALMSGGEMYLDPQTVASTPPGVLETIAARQAPHFAGGGIVPGDPRSDSTMVMAQPGGFVLTGDGQSMFAGMMGYAKGGSIRGKVSTFGPPGEASGGTAYGFSSSAPGIAVNPKGQSNSWNDAEARSYEKKILRVTIGGKSALLRVIDKGPSIPGRMIDVTGAGAKKMGINPRSFPTDAIGTAVLAGSAADTKQAATKGTKGTKAIPGHVTSALGALDPSQAARFLPDWLKGSVKDAFSQGIALGGRGLAGSELLQTIITGSRVPTTKTAGTPGTPGKKSGKAGDTGGRGSAPYRGYPLSRVGKIIGTPHSGTHTLGNWQSDNAVDIGIPVGTAVLAATSGRITKLGGQAGSSGRFAGFQTTIGNQLFYTHQSSRSVKAGQAVRQGQVIGRSGSANGVAHLHFGVRPPKSPYDYVHKKRRGGFISGMRRFRTGGGTGGTKAPTGIPKSVADALTVVGGIAGTPTTGGNADIADAMTALAEMLAAMTTAQIDQITYLIKQQITKLSVGGVTKKEHAEILRLTNVISLLDATVGDRVGGIFQYVTDALTSIERKGAATDRATAIAGTDPASAAGLAAHGVQDVMKGSALQNLMAPLLVALDEATKHGDPDAIKTAQDNVNQLQDAIDDNFVDYVQTMKSAATAAAQEGIAASQNVIDRAQATFELTQAQARVVGGPSFAGSGADLRAQAGRQAAAAPQFLELAGKYGASSWVKALQGDLSGAQADELSMIQAQTAAANAVADAADLLQQAAKAEIQATVDAANQQATLFGAQSDRAAAAARLAGGPGYVGSAAELQRQASAAQAQAVAQQQLAQAYSDATQGFLHVGDTNAAADAYASMFSAAAAADNALADAAEALRSAATAAQQVFVDAAQFGESLAQTQYARLQLQEQLAGTFDTSGAARAQFITSTIEPAIQADIDALAGATSVAIQQYGENSKEARDARLAEESKRNDLLQAQLDAQTAIKENTDVLKNLAGPIGFQFQGQTETARFASALSGG